MSAGLLMLQLVLAPVAGAGGCGETCSLEDRHGPPALSAVDFRELRDQWATEAIGEPTEALETLLFHADGTRLWLEQQGPGD